MARPDWDSGPGHPHPIDRADRVRRILLVAAIGGLLIGLALALVAIGTGA